MSNISKYDFNKRLKIFLVLSIIFAGAFTSNASLTARQVVEKSANLLSGDKGISVDFTVITGGKSFKGSIISQGNRFVVMTPQIHTWHDGKNLYMYNSNTEETTVTIPTLSELLESNPLLYIKGASDSYTYKFASSNKKGKYIVEMRPIDKKSAISLITATINSNTFQPERIAVKTSSSTSSAVVNSFKSGLNFPASQFTYPKSKYPNAEIIDLR